MSEPKRRPAPRLILEPELLRTADSAALLGMSEAGFKQLAARGAVGPRPVRFGARCTRWRRRELADWVDAGCPGREAWTAQQSTGGGGAHPRLAEAS